MQFDNLSFQMMLQVTKNLGGLNNRESVCACAHMHT